MPVFIVKCCVFLGQVDERNRKEAEILLGSLGEQLIPAHEKLSETGQLRTLALLHQTMVSTGYEALLLYFLTPG